MINNPKGTHDIIFGEARVYDEIENLCVAFASVYGFSPLRTPIFEATELFKRGVGDSTDIVNKEMYTFLDKGNRSMTLRPEGTASVVRSVISNKLYATHDLPLKIYYLGPMFRYERPQLGRYRQFNQFGVESLGVTSSYEDAEVIVLGWMLLKALGFDKLTLKINTLGDKDSRERYKVALKEYFNEHLDHMCTDCQKRYVTNPLRMLDCKVPSDQEIAKKAPRMSLFLSEDAKARFNNVLSVLKSLEIPYEIDENLVRGLDYYSETVFEFSYESSSGKDYGALGGGGHYDRLVSELGGPELEGVGFALGIERIFNVLQDENLVNIPENMLDIYVMSTEKTRPMALFIATALRNAGYRTDLNFVDKPFKRLFKKADKENALFAVIIGEDELKDSNVSIKNLKTQVQKTVPITEMFTRLDEMMDEYQKYLQDQKAKEKEENDVSH